MSVTAVARGTTTHPRHTLLAIAAAAAATAGLLGAGMVVDSAGDSVKRSAHSASKAGPPAIFGGRLNTPVRPAK
jgi:hypothetical protein